MKLVKTQTLLGLWVQQDVDVWQFNIFKLQHSCSTERQHQAVQQYHSKQYTCMAHPPWSARMKARDSSGSFTCTCMCLHSKQ